MRTATSATPSRPAGASQTGSRTPSTTPSNAKPPATPTTRASSPPSSPATAAAHARPPTTCGGARVDNASPLDEVRERLRAGENVTPKQLLEAEGRARLDELTADVDAERREEEATRQREAAAAAVVERLRTGSLAAARRPHRRPPRPRSPPCSPTSPTRSAPSTASSPAPSVTCSASAACPPTSPSPSAPATAATGSRSTGSASTATTPGCSSPRSHTPPRPSTSAAAVASASAARPSTATARWPADEPQGRTTAPAAELAAGPARRAPTRPLGLLRRGQPGADQVDQSSPRPGRQRRHEQPRRHPRPPVPRSKSSREALRARGVGPDRQRPPAPHPGLVGGSR